MLSLLPLPLLLLLALAPLGHAAEPGFTSLFDGRTLQGWRGESPWWRVENGSIVGEIPKGTQLNHNTWLVSDHGPHTHFELRLEFRLQGDKAANSGIQFRSRVTSVTEVAGYQADLDDGQTWLGRIYDEHGRALLVERGHRVHIAPDGSRTAERFADPKLFATLFRENEWNDYRILACDNHIRVEINGTLFSELTDNQTGKNATNGSLALQLHSGPHTRVEFRNIRQRPIPSGSFSIPLPRPQPNPEPTTRFPALRPDGSPLNLGFESGSLQDWVATGNAFNNQPVDKDGISQRWPGTSSGKAGRFFIGGFEQVGDTATGTLTSSPFTLSHPYASFLVGGGQETSTRVEIALLDTPPRVIFTASGANRETMDRVYADLSAYQGRLAVVRLIDEATGGWGHLNFDDFQFHRDPPLALSDKRPARIRENPVLAHLVPNPRLPAPDIPLPQMWVEPGFEVETIASEPTIHQPVAFTFDEKGRLWVVEAFSYPQKRPNGQGEDRIVILEDTNGDGSFDSAKTFISGLNLVSGIELGFGGVWVGAAPELLFIPDRNRDDKPDAPPTILLDGFGYQDTHETLNSFLWGPDGWLYGTQGVFNYSRIGKPGTPDNLRLPMSAGVWRYHPVRHQFEVFATGGSNPWGLDFDDHGQLFMTHCRSFYGRGLTTHVIQGGHFWNQMNQGYANFISADPLPDLPWMQNFLLASARYGHGEGGAGKPGTGRIYGGHSHVGTMIYLGDNWPAEYRNQLFTHNLHGHQINRQRNLREGSGYNTVHAGSDILYTPNPEYVAVDLEYGPDGAVYFSDWVDPQHCHNPNAEQWDRRNGRIYRLAYTPTFKPTLVGDLTTKSDTDLLALLSHPNDWFVRKARRILQERAATRTLAPNTPRDLALRLSRENHTPTKLRQLWALHAVNGIDTPLHRSLLRDPSEFVRAWSIQLAAETSPIPQPLLNQWLNLAAKDPSPFVRLYLASALQRLPTPNAWALAETLARHPEDASDRNLTKLLWHGVAPLTESNLNRALALAQTTQLPHLADYIHWYAAKRGGPSLNRIIESLTNSLSSARTLDLIGLAVKNQPGLPTPTAWSSLSPRFYQNPNPNLRTLAETIGSVFGDRSLLPSMQQRASDRTQPIAARRHAFDIIRRAADPSSFQLLVSLLDDPEFKRDAINLLARLDHPDAGRILIQTFPRLDDKSKASALASLTQRASLGRQLLDAMLSGTLDRTQLTAFHVRQLHVLKDPEIDQKLEKVWGKVANSPGELQEKITRITRTYEEAPLWAYSTSEGKKHFQLLCSSCHQVRGEGSRIGPELTGAGANGARYFIENIIGPNAVIGSAYQSTLIETTGGESLSGLVESDAPTALSLRTITGPILIPKTQIKSRTLSESSMMPAGLFDGLNERQIIELLKYLTSI